MEERVMMNGCPHCKDGIPAIVTYRIVEMPEDTNFVGDEWTQELIEAIKEYGQMWIVACRKIKSDKE